MKVKKLSGKPFKSGEKINTVKGTTSNPYTNKPAYTFHEDDSVVDQHICVEVPRIEHCPVCEDLDCVIQSAKGVCKCQNCGEEYFTMGKVLEDEYILDNLPDGLDFNYIQTAVTHSEDGRLTGE